MSKGTRLEDRINARIKKTGDAVYLTWITQAALNIGGLSTIEPFITLSGECVRYKFNDGSTYETELAGEPFPTINKEHPKHVKSQ